jgi:hypothetical protein
VVLATIALKRDVAYIAKKFPYTAADIFTVLLLVNVVNICKQECSSRRWRFIFNITDRENAPIVF